MCRETDIWVMGALICTTIPPFIRLCVQPGPLLNANGNRTILAANVDTTISLMSKLGDRCHSQKSHLHIAVKIIFPFLSNGIL